MEFRLHGTPENSCTAASISRKKQKTESLPATDYGHKRDPLPSSLSIPYPRTDSKNKMPTKLCPRKSGTVFGPNTKVKRAQRHAEATQYLRAPSQNTS